MIEYMTVILYQGSQPPTDHVTRYVHLVTRLNTMGHFVLTWINVKHSMVDK